MYPKAIKLEAQRLWEDCNLTYDMISRKLKIKRWQTISDWRVKFKWKEHSGAKNSFFCEAEDIMDLEKGGRKAIECLAGDLEFKSKREAAEVLELIRRFLELTSKSTQSEAEQEISKKVNESKNIISILDKFGKKDSAL